MRACQHSDNFYNSIPLVQVKAGVLYRLEGKLTSLRQQACSSKELSGELNGKAHQ